MKFLFTNDEIKRWGWRANYPSFQTIALNEKSIPWLKKILK